MGVQYIRGCSFGEYYEWNIIGVFNISQRLLLICSPTWIISSQSANDTPYMSHDIPDVLDTIPSIYWTSPDVMNTHYTGWEHSNFNTETKCKWAGHSVNPNICYRVVTGMFNLKKNCGGICSSNWFLSRLILWWTVHASTCIYKQYVNLSQVNEAMQYKCQKTNQKLMIINEEWPKYNNEKINFCQCVITLKALAITKEL